MLSITETFELLLTDISLCSILLQNFVFKCMKLVFALNHFEYDSVDKNVAEKHANFFRYFEIANQLTTIFNSFLFKSFKQALHLLEFLKFNTVLGVSHFTFYNHTLGHRSNCMIKHYYMNRDNLPDNTSSKNDYRQPKGKSSNILNQRTTVNILQEAQSNVVEMVVVALALLVAEPCPEFPRWVCCCCN